MLGFGYTSPNNKRDRSRRSPLTQARQCFRFHHTVGGFVFLYFFEGLLRELEALTTASPQLAFEKLNPVRKAVRSVALFSATALAYLLGYVSFSVYRAGPWPPPGWRVVYTM
jgi:hypothetical protein